MSQRQAAYSRRRFLRRAGRARVGDSADHSRLGLGDHRVVAPSPDRDRGFGIAPRMHDLNCMLNEPDVSSWRSATFRRLRG